MGEFPGNRIYPARV